MFDAVQYAMGMYGFRKDVNHPHKRRSLTCPEVLERRAHSGTYPGNQTCVEAGGG